MELAVGLSFNLLSLYYMDWRLKCQAALAYRIMFNTVKISFLNETYASFFSMIMG